MADNCVSLWQWIKIDGRIIRYIFACDFEVEIRTSAAPTCILGIGEVLRKQAPIAREEVSVSRLARRRCWQFELDCRAAGNADLLADEPIRFRSELDRRAVRRGESLLWRIDLRRR